MEGRKESLGRLFPYLLLAIIVGALIPVLALGIFEPINDDGYFHLFLSIQGSWEAFRGHWRGCAHPILYFLVLRVPALFGHSNMVYRLASIVPGMASVYLLGLIAARLCQSKAVALLAAAAYGFSATMREIVIDIRSYPLALFFVLAAFYCLVDALAGDGRRNRSLMWFGIFTSLAIASAYYAILFLFACLGSLALLLAAHPLLRGRTRAWASRNWHVLIVALGLPFAVISGFYLAHMKYQMTGLASWYIPDFYWRPGISRVDFVLRNLRADFNYMLPVEMSSAGMAFGVLAVFAPILLCRAFSRKRSGESLASGLPGLLSLLLLAELIALSLLRLYPFGGQARQQSVLFPFFALTAFLLLDQLIGFLATIRRLRWLPAGILGLTAAAIAANSSGVKFEDVPSFHATPVAGSWGRAVLPARTTRGKAGIQWVRIPGGTFMMGASDISPSERPRHEVKIKPFEMAQTLVTNKQYRACVAAGFCTAAQWYGPWFAGDSQPVIGANWAQAQAFSRWAGGRLPTEAEWEYAARSGGREQNLPWGDEAATCARAVLADCGYGPTAPVCSKPAGNTRQGLCDMAGNVWEWVQDSYHASYHGAPADGSAWEVPVGAVRVVRGSSWYDVAGSARSALRGNHDPGHRYNALGFRPARRLR